MSAKGFDYFESFRKMTAFSLAAAQKLQSTLCDFSASRLEEDVHDIHKIEQSADEEKHEMMSRLAKEFIPPIEREDIASLAQELDEVTDCIDDVLMTMYIFNISELLPAALDFSDVIVKCCSALNAAAEDLKNFKKSKAIRPNIVEVNRLEEEGDTLYTHAVYTLHRSDTDTLSVLRWTRIFDRLEKCCDSCEHVANAIETVIMKNT